jgi:GNAT superfamily N-acetyltransferase
MTVSIRRLAEGDSISELTALLHAAYARLAVLGFNYTAVDQSEDVTRRRIAQGECYVACDGPKLVGTITYRRQSSGCDWYARPDVAVINQLGILPTYQGKGLGNALMSLSEDRARETGAAELALDTSEGASHLVAWYGRRGYRQVEIVRWDGKVYRSLILSKAL